jgi:DNA-binding phage protein
MNTSKTVNPHNLPDFDMADYLKTDEDVANYLTLVLEENDPAELTLAHEKIHQASAKKWPLEGRSEQQPH